MGHKPKIANILEEPVAEMVEKILSRRTDICTCDLCRADITCAALNQLPPRYVVRRFGAILSRTEYETDQGRADILSAINRAIRTVSKAPHHNGPRFSGSTSTRP